LPPAPDFFCGDSAEALVTYKDLRCPEAEFHLFLLLLPNVW